jgi:hypothetical protein
MGHATGIFWVDLTPFSLQLLLIVVFAVASLLRSAVRYILYSGVAGLNASMEGRTMLKEAVNWLITAKILHIAVAVRSDSLWASVALGVYTFCDALSNRVNGKSLL